MPNFIWTARDIQGKLVSKEISANTIEDSKAILLSEGYTDLELKGDEIIDAARISVADANKTDPFQNEATPKKLPVERVKSYGFLPQTTLKIILRRIVQDSVLYFIAISIIAGMLFLGHQSYAITVGIVMAIWLLFRIWMSLTQIYYAKLNRAKDWNQWTQVLRIVKKMEILRKFHSIKFPLSTLIHARAQALAGSGKLLEALAEFQQCQYQPGMQSWLYKTHLAQIYSIAKDYDKSLECAWKAVEEKQTPALYLDLANRLLSYKKDTIKAREAIYKAEQGEITEIAKPYLKRCRGILFYLEGNFDLARQEFESSLEIYERNKNRPFIDGSISEVKGYLSCVLAKQGDMDAARTYYIQARKYLIATEDTKLIEECEKIIGR